VNIAEGTQHYKQSQNSEQQLVQLLDRHIHGVSNDPHNQSLEFVYLVNTANALDWAGTCDIMKVSDLLFKTFNRPYNNQGVLLSPLYITGLSPKKLKCL